MGVDSRQALDRMFADEQPRTVYGRIVARLAGDRYEVLTAGGQTVFAVSADFYPPGMAVVLRDGEVVGGGAAAGKHNLYEV